MSFEVRKEDNSCLVYLAKLAMIVHHIHFSLYFFLFRGGGNFNRPFIYLAIPTIKGVNLSNFVSR